ncbi:MAG TPA: biopolymer transporter ExbD [Phenylobacterium sp.]|nr:biopolymer transporter ExbD [Phenylobacterium sp.]
MAAALSTTRSPWNLGQNAEINVTPFVDVMLVLLIIFMVALPTATVSVKVDLPKAQASPDRALPPVVVSLTLDGRLFVGDRPTSLPQLVAAASAALGRDPTAQRLYLRADKGVRYGELMAVMNTLHASGFDKVALVSEEL